MGCGCKKDKPREKPKVIISEPIPQSPSEQLAIETKEWIEKLSQEHKDKKEDI